MARKIIKILVSSTVYGFEKDLQQLYATIDSYKSRKVEYRVLNSYAVSRGVIDAVFDAVFDAVKIVAGNENECR